MNISPRFGAIIRASYPYGTLNHHRTGTSYQQLAPIHNAAADAVHKLERRALVGTDGSSMIIATGEGRSYAHAEIEAALEAKGFRIQHPQYSSDPWAHLAEAEAEHNPVRGTVADYSTKGNPGSKFLVRTSETKGVWFDRNEEGLLVQRAAARWEQATEKSIEAASAQYPSPERAAQEDSRLGIETAGRQSKTIANASDPKGFRVRRSPRN